MIDATKTPDWHARSHEARTTGAFASTALVCLSLLATNDATRCVHLSSQFCEYWPPRSTSILRTSARSGSTSPEKHARTPLSTDDAGSFAEPELRRVTRVVLAVVLEEVVAAAAAVVDDAADAAVVEPCLLLVLLVLLVMAVFVSLAVAVGIEGILNSIGVATGANFAAVVTADDDDDDEVAVVVVVVDAVPAACAAVDATSRSAVASFSLSRRSLKINAHSPMGLEKKC